MANALRGLGHVERELSHPEVARQHFTEAQRLYKQCGNGMGEANAIFALAEMDRTIGSEHVGRIRYRDAAILFGLAEQKQGQVLAHRLATEV